jgi:xylose isomerase
MSPWRLLPAHGRARARSDRELDHGDIVGVNPETGHEQMANLNYTHALGQASGAASCSTSISTDNVASSTTRIWVFGHGDLMSAFFTVDLVENGFPGYPDAPRYTGPSTSTTSLRVPSTWRVLGVGGSMHVDVPDACREGAGLPRRSSRREAMAYSGVLDLAQSTCPRGDGRSRTSSMPTMTLTQ